MEAGESYDGTPRSSRERLEAFVEMKELVMAATETDLDNMSQEITFLAGAYQLAAEAVTSVSADGEQAEEAHPTASMVKAETRRRGVLINDEMSELESYAETVFVSEKRPLLSLSLSLSVRVRVRRARARVCLCVCVCVCVCVCGCPRTCVSLLWLH